MDTRMQSEREHAKRAMDEASAAAREAGEHLQETGRETASRLGAAWESAKHNIQDKASTSARATDRAIRDHPYETIGIAFGVGVLIGVLINRK